MIHTKKRLQPSTLVRRWSVLAVSAFTFSLGSCGTPPSPTSTTGAESPQAESPTASATNELQIVTTFVPMTQFTQAVAGNRAKVNQLLPTNVGPHDYQAKPEDVQKLANADVLVQNGLDMEEFLEDMVKNAENTQLTVIDSSRGIPTIKTKSIAGEAHQDKADNHDHETDTKKTENAGNEHEHGEFNPHIWLDPKLAIRQVETIRDGLMAKDPQGKEIYTTNAAAYIQKLRDLDAETTKLLQPYTGKTFVAFHDFAPYFAQSYNLKANFLVDVPEENPSPEDVKRVTDEVKKSNLKAILTEPLAGENAFAALAKDINVRIINFDPMETGGPEALEPTYYIKTMRQNVKSLVNAFGGPTLSVLPLWVPQPAAVVPQRVGVRF